MVGFVVGYVAFQIDRVVGSPEVFTDASAELLAEPEVQEELIAQIANALSVQYADELDLARAFGVEGIDDADTTFEAIARATIASPEFRAAWDAAIVDIHHSAFVDPEFSPMLDAAAITTATTRAASTIEPRLVPLLGQGELLRVEVSHRDIPDLTRIPGWILAAKLLAVAAAALGAGLALALHPEPWRPVRALGVVSGLAGLLTLALARVVPPLVPVVVGGAAGDNDAVAERVARTAVDAFGPLTYATLALGIGLLLFSGGWQLWARRNQASPAPSLATAPLHL